LKLICDKDNHYFANLIKNMKNSSFSIEVIKDQVGIAVPAEAWGTDVLMLTDEQKAALKALADRL
jgi:hypothetical protein